MKVTKKKKRASKGLRDYNRDRKILILEKRLKGMEDKVSRLEDQVWNIRNPYDGV